MESHLKQYIEVSLELFSRFHLYSNDLSKVFFDQWIAADISKTQLKMTMSCFTKKKCNSIK